MPRTGPPPAGSTPLFPQKQSASEKTKGSADIRGQEYHIIVNKEVISMKWLK